MRWLKNLFAAPGKEARNSPTTRLRVEELEGRDVPNYTVAQVPGVGVLLHNDNEFVGRVGWTRLTSVDAERVDVTGTGVVVGDFGAYGIYRFSYSTGWQRLTTANPSRIAISGNGGQVAAVFPGLGTWRFDNEAGRWHKLSQFDANAIDIIGSFGDVVFNLPGHGLYYFDYTPGTLTGRILKLTSVSASLVSGDGPGYVAAYFPGHGLYRWHSSTGWRGLAGNEVISMDVNASGHVVASFRGLGTWEYGANFSGSARWEKIESATASQVSIQDDNAVIGDFGAIWYYNHSTDRWEQLYSGNPTWLKTD